MTPAPRFLLLRRCPAVILAALAWGLAGVPSRAAEPGPAPAANRTALEALQRLRGMDLDANPALRTAVLRILETTRGTPAFVELVRDFRLTGQEQGLLETAAALPGDAAGAEALRLVLAAEQIDPIRAALRSEPPGRQAALVEALANSADRRALPFLVAGATNTAGAGPVRGAAVRGLARSEEGARELLRLGREGNLDDAARNTASLVLAQARWPAIREEAGVVFPLPRAADGQSLPPLAELAVAHGDAGRGAAVFRGERAACMKCHRVGAEGIDFGPALTQIGTKLGRTALLEAILDPNAGISFGFEGWDVLLRNGDELSGLLASETASELAVKQPSGVVVRVPKSDVIRRDLQKLSVMPANLGQILTRDELVDLVEYLTTLKAP